jgi:hypothetical protein
MYDDHGSSSYMGKATIVDINNFVEIPCPKKIITIIL